MSKDAKDTRPNYRIDALKIDETSSKPQITAVVDLKGFQKPSMEMHVAGVTGGEAGCQCNPVCVCVPVESCACDKVCTCDKVCACENVCSCVGYRSCAFIYCICNPIIVPEGQHELMFDTARIMK